MKKKGFTLIELLAVIVILAIIALIITPIISNVIDSSRKAAFRESVNGIIDSGGSYLQEYILKYNNELNDFPVEFPCDGTKCGNGEFTLTFKGNVPKSGNIIIKEDGVLAEYISDGKYCAYGYKWNLVVESSCGEVDVTKPTITGTQSGKTITLIMTDNESGVDKYCVNEENTTDGCSWITPANPSNEEYTIESPGKYYFFVRDKKGNASDSINFTTTHGDYCQLIPNQVVGEYSYTGGLQTYPVEDGCGGVYKLEVWGAQGGSYGGGSGGKGGYATGNVNLAEGTILNVVVGGGGTAATAEHGSSGSAQGTYNGGGSCSVGSHSWSWCTYATGTGGGATHIASKDSNDTYNILSSYGDEETAANYVYLVAGGGGGGYYDRDTPSYCKNGGVGGLSASGSFGQGSNGGQGGGGGFYGGTGGNGGSSYIGGVYDGQTIAGNASMPTHDGTSTMSGNGGNGYAKITYLGRVITITYNTNGGVLDNYTKVLTGTGLIGELATPSKDGQTFWGWYLDEDFNTIADPNKLLTRDTTVYARWSGPSISFEYTGKMQAVSVPTTGTYKLEVWGASGGAAGGYATGNVNLTADSIIYIGVGGQGESKDKDSSYARGGFNGGGNGGWSSAHGYGTHYYNGGGGATHIGTVNDVLKNTPVENVYIVAGGGGGSASTGSTAGPSSGSGGYGGGLTGGSGTGTDTAGVSIGGGRGGDQAPASGSVYGQGGNGSAGTTHNSYGGGGGGYYGGAGGYSISSGGSGTGSSGGGGGSSYIGGVSNGQTIAGNASMPTHDGTSTMTGNGGHGYAKITLLSN